MSRQQDRYYLDMRDVATKHARLAGLPCNSTVHYHLSPGIYDIIVRWHRLSAPTVEDVESCLFFDMRKLSEDRRYSLDSTLLLNQIRFAMSIENVYRALRLWELPPTADGKHFD